MSSKQKKKALSGRFAIFITILLFVCTVIFFNNKFSSGSLKKVAYWIFSGISGDATDASISFDSNEYNRFALLNGNLCVISPEEINIYKLSGKNTLTEPVILRSPSVSVSGSRFVAYDLGGLNYSVSNAGKLLFRGESKSKILNVNLNKTGFFSMITDDPDCKSLVSVFNPTFEAIYKFHSSDKYVFDAAVSPNGKNVAMLLYSTNDGHFETTLALAKTDRDGFGYTEPLGDSVPLKITYHTDGKLLVLCSDKLFIYENDGKRISEYSFNNLPLKAYDEAPGRHIVLLLDDYQNGGNTKLVVLKNNGEVLSEASLSDDVYSVSTAGNYVSVQFADKCIVYKTDLTPHNEFIIPTSITRCILNRDGSIIAISENSASLFVS